MKHKTPSLRETSVGDLQSRRAALVRGLPPLEGLLRCSLQHQYRKCGKEGCRCNQGELHGPYVYLAVRGEGRRGLVYVGAEAVQKVERLVQVAGEIEGALAEISAINIELLARGELD
jgi:hypothetical protein